MFDAVESYFVQLSCGEKGIVESLDGEIIVKEK